MKVNGVEVDVQKIIKEEENSIKAIKKIRELTGAGLKEAKEAVENYSTEVIFENIKNGIGNFDDEIKKLPGYAVWGTKKEVKHLKSMLHEDENVLSIASGVMDGNTWLIACTNKRIIFIDSGMIYGVKHSEVMINKINAVSFKNGMVLGEIHIEDGANTRIIKNVQKSSTKPFVDAVHEAMEMQSQNKTIVQQQSLSVADELLKFKQLLDIGAITEKEYEQQKMKLLG